MISSSSSFGACTCETTRSCAGPSSVISTVPARIGTYSLKRRDDDDAGVDARSFGGGGARSGGAADENAATATTTRARLWGTPQLAIHVVVAPVANVGAAFTAARARATGGREGRPSTGARARAAVKAAPPCGRAALHSRPCRSTRLPRSFVARDAK